MHAWQVNATLTRLPLPPKIAIAPAEEALCKLRTLGREALLRSRVAPEGAEGLDGARPEDVLVVERRDGSAHERAHPEDPLQKRVNQININQYICSARTSVK